MITIGGSPGTRHYAAGPGVGSALAVTGGTWRRILAGGKTGWPPHHSLFFNYLAALLTGKVQQWAVTIKRAQRVCHLQSHSIRVISGRSKSGGGGAPGACRSLAGKAGAHHPTLWSGYAHPITHVHRRLDLVGDPCLCKSRAELSSPCPSPRAKHLAGPSLTAFQEQGPRTQ